MTLALTPLPTVDLSTVDLFRISVEQYHAMIEAEILTTSDRVELLEGVLVYKMSKDESHVVAEESVSDAVEKQLPNTFSYRSQNPITLPDGEPEPDGAVVRGDRRTYLREGRKPGAADTLLVIEVSGSSLRLDQTIKLRSYARAGIPIYWIINLIDRVIEVYSDPDPSAQPEPVYRNKTIYNSTASVPLVIAGQTVGGVNVADVLP